MSDTNIPDTVTETLWAADLQPGRVISVPMWGRRETVATIEHLDDCWVHLTTEQGSDYWWPGDLEIHALT